MVTDSRELGKVGAYAPAVILPSGRIVAVSGIVALDQQGKLVGEGSVREQARFIFSEIDTLLAEGGGSLSDVVKITAYLTDMAQYGEYSAARAEAFRDRPKPASAAIGVAALVDPKWLVEIEALAVLKAAP